MKIISKFKDYYDAGQVYHDDFYTFNRETCNKIITSPHIFVHDLKSYLFTVNNFKHTSNINFGIIYFCEKYYPYVKIIYSSSDNSKNKCFFNYDDLASEAGIVQHIESMYTGYLLKSDNFDIIKSFFKNDYSLKEDLHLKYNCPYFIYEFNVSKNQKTTNAGDHVFIINPNLKEKQFFKMFSPFDAYQEIDMFIGRHLANIPKEIVEISDKDKINQHGFDPKYGFRKTPKTKK